ncbi:MAG: hypothetical protein A4E32_01778 [Methanomassiliicoccales archaeon PtaU1.Bin124]|nr:MAG: hypothetical protein A4E32_01778 [Methanomassiliicoccales archaeon PtaU1.Bin124]
MNVSKRVISIISNTSLMMLIGLIISLGIGGFPSDFTVKSGTISMVCLIIMMTLALSTLDLKKIRFGPYKKDALNAFFLSFVASTGVTLCIAFMFTGDLRSGWILEAAVPSAVSVISFTYLWGGDVESSAVSSILIYLLALIVTPLITLIFMGEAVSQITLLYYVGILIIIPLCLSPFVRKLDIPKTVRVVFINIAFSVLVIAVAGQGRDVFFSSGTIIIALIFFSVVRLFGLGLLHHYVLNKGGVERSKIVPGSLFITYKNTGMAAALALVLIGPAAAVPAAITIVVEISWLIFAGRFLFNKERDTPSTEPHHDAA